MLESSITAICPEDPHGAAKAYLFGRLLTAEADAFERHFIGCSKCLSTLEEERAIIRAFNAAIGANQP